MVRDAGGASGPVSLGPRQRRAAGAPEASPSWLLTYNDGLTDQLHFDLLAFVNALTELTTLAASVESDTISDAEGLGGSDVTALLSELTDVFTALVSFGKSLLAEATTAAASLSIAESCDFTPLTSLLALRLVKPLMDFSRLARSAQ